MINAISLNTIPTQKYFITLTSEDANAIKSQKIFKITNLEPNNILKLKSFTPILNLYIKDTKFSSIDINVKYNFKVSIFLTSADEETPTVPTSNSDTCQIIESNKTGDERPNLGESISFNSTSGILVENNSINKKSVYFAFQITEHDPVNIQVDESYYNNSNTNASIDINADVNIDFNYETNVTNATVITTNGMYVNTDSESKLYVGKSGFVAENTFCMDKLSEVCKNINQDGLRITKSGLQRLRYYNKDKENKVIEKWSNNLNIVPSLCIFGDYNNYKFNLSNTKIKNNIRTKYTEKVFGFNNNTKLTFKFAYTYILSYDYSNILINCNYDNKYIINDNIFNTINSNNSSKTAKEFVTTYLKTSYYSTSGDDATVNYQGSLYIIPNVETVLNSTYYKSNGIIDNDVVTNIIPNGFELKVANNSNIDINLYLPKHCNDFVTNYDIISRHNSRVTINKNSIATYSVFTSPSTSTTNNNETYFHHYNCIWQKWN